MDHTDADLQRKVLAHEQILQVLISHMAETEPKFLERLSAVFADPARQGRSEHSYVDTAAYAERFIREVVRLSERSSRASARPVR